LIPAARSIKKRNVQPDYTNICIMGTYVCYMVGDLCHLPEMTAYARERLRNFYGYTLRNGGFAEYNSPTYTLVSMDELLRMKQTILHPDDRRMIEDLYTMTWDLIARHFHHPSGQWCGPHLRAYNDLADADFYRLLYNASGGRIELPGDYLRIPNVIKPHCIPESVMPKFSQPVLPRLEIDTFVSADPLRKEIVGKLYASPAFALASVNQSYMWNQTRPLIAHWGTPEKPSCLRVRFLHDKHDFSAVNIASVQDSTSVLAIFNIAVDGGDTHPILDPIQNASIRASDLRLRIEAGGNLDGLQFTIPDRYGDAAGFDTPTVEAAFQIPYAGWDNYTGHWEKWADEKHCGIDYVLYSGDARTFRLDEMQEAVVGLYLAFSDKSGDELALPNVTSERQGDYLILSTKQMTIKAPAKPDKESRIKNDISH
ncbi:MAG: hypothetical protein LBC40_01085, partial [Dysgonamonadaceae bacterium]|nr:hypothetical protein [Dysgonamonadaceae bacterium]